MTGAAQIEPSHACKGRVQSVVPRVCTRLNRRLLRKLSDLRGRAAPRIAYRVPLDVRDARQCGLRVMRELIDHIVGADPGKRLRLDDYGKRFVVSVDGRGDRLVSPCLFRGAAGLLICESDVQRVGCWIAGLYDRPKGD
jgi:hypothetical protein